jgi:hypothetical protein
MRLLRLILMVAMVGTPAAGAARDLVPAPTVLAAAEGALAAPAGAVRIAF